MEAVVGAAPAPVSTGARRHHGGHGEGILRRASYVGHSFPIKVAGGPRRRHHGGLHHGGRGEGTGGRPCRACAGGSYAGM